jgi:hypothetical protein
MGRVEGKVALGTGAARGQGPDRVPGSSPPDWSAWTSCSMPQVSMTRSSRVTCPGSGSWELGACTATATFPQRIRALRQVIGMR